MSGSRLQQMLSLFALMIVWSTLQSQGILPTHLTCEYMQEVPLVDEPFPLLGWINTPQDTMRGHRQTAWQIRVASKPELLTSPDLWNSGKVASSQHHEIPYAGTMLKSRQTCWWQVRVWDEKDEPSAWSEPAKWRMGLLKPEDWQATWIGAPWQGEAALPKPPGGPQNRTEELPPPAPLIRKSFSIDKPVKDAVVYTTGLGYFELYLNGKRIGNDELVPNQTNYGKRPEITEALISLPDSFARYKVMYLAYEVDSVLQSGENVIGSILGNGWYNAPKFWSASYGSPRFLCQLHLTYTDGSEEIIASDLSWKADSSAILMDLIYDGEHYDARREQPGWNMPGFDDRDWEHVVPRQAPEGELVAHTAYPDRVTLRLPPREIELLGPGHYRVDFGVEISGRLRLQNVTAPAGHKVDIKYISNTFSGDNSYTFRGDGPESYASRFNWFVFSAVEITNWPGTLSSQQVLAEAVNTWIEETATFESSEPMLEDIHAIWKRSQLDNMHGGIASDCPHRERSAYTGDGQVACVQVMHNYDARSFFHKWIGDIREAQLPNGYVPNGAPWQPGCGGGVAWGAAICIMPWEFYQHYGSLRMLRENYDAMQGYLQYMQRWVDETGIMHSQATGKDGNPLKWLNLGEWSDPGPAIPDELVHTFYFWRCADITAQTAKAIGRHPEAVHYEKLAQRTWQAFHRRFWQTETQTYGAGGGNILALRMGVPDERLKAVLQAVRQDLKATNGHLDTGIFGTRWFFEMLSEHGMHELAYQAMTKRTEPSFGWWLEQGATTTREDWDSSGSHNHPMFGGGLTWLYKYLAGMRVDPDQQAYTHIIFEPLPVAGLDSMSYYNQTIHGQAGMSWKQDGSSLFVQVTVPVGSTATLRLPADSEEIILESGKPAASQTGVDILGHIDGKAQIRLVSGTYNFKI